MYLDSKLTGEPMEENSNGREVINLVTNDLIREYSLSEEGGTATTLSYNRSILKKKKFLS